MSTFKPTTKLPDVKGARIAIATAEWNAHITGALTDGALETLKANGITDKDIDVYSVPGAVELTYAASQLIESSMYDA